MARGKSTAKMIAELEKLEAEQAAERERARQRAKAIREQTKAAESAALEDLGRWVVERLSTTADASMTARIAEVRELIEDESGADESEGEGTVTLGSSSDDGSGGYGVAESTSDEQGDAQRYL